MDKLERIAEKLKKRTEERDTELVENEKELSLKSSALLKNSYRRAEQLKETLIDEFEGTEVEEATNCSLKSNNYGEVYHKKEEVNTDFRTPNHCRERVLSDLKLLHGIGPAREQKLKEKSYETIEDLKKHRKWREKAESFLEKFENSPCDTFTHVEKWKSPTDPLLLNLSSQFNEEDFAILDIETMGLTNQPVILIGAALPGENETELHQFLLKDVDQEVAALSSIQDKLKDREAVVTFNGKTFDIPYLERRLNFYGLSPELNHTHLDLYHFSKKAWKNSLPNYQLTTIEKQILDIDRPVDIPSSMVPQFYSTYRNTGNPGPSYP